MDRMELKSNYFLIIDACSFINLVNIDFEHQEILKLLNSYFDFRFPEKVQSEIENNIRNKADGILVKTNGDKEKKAELNEYIDQILGNLWSNVTQDIQFKKEFGGRIYFALEKHIGPNTNKGEWYCVAHSLCLSRFLQRRLTFVTDDFPAKNNFSNTFENHKIGFIEDTSDLFLLMYWNCPEIDQKKLERFLTDLYAEYRSEVNGLLNKLRNFRDKKLSYKDRILRIKISEFEKKLEQLDFKNLKEIKRELINASGGNKKHFKKLFSKYNTIFSLSNDDYNLLVKINNILEYLRSSTVYKLYN